LSETAQIVDPWNHVFLILLNDRTRFLTLTFLLRLPKNSLQSPKVNGRPGGKTCNGDKQDRVKAQQSDKRIAKRYRPKWREVSVEE
jgi:hypothetical protein